MDNNAESGCSDNPKTSSNMDTTSMNMMTDIKIFINLLQLVGQCPECSNAITTTVDFSSKKGLAQKIKSSCKDITGCAWTYSTYTSTMTKNDERSRYDVNIRSIITFGETRRDLSHIETSHRIMNMSPPYSHSTYDDTMNMSPPYSHSTYDDTMNMSPPYSHSTYDDTMNMSPPYSHSTYDDIMKDVLPHYIATMNTVL